MRKYPCSFMFQQITCIPQVVTITNLLHPPDDSIFPIRLVIPSPSWITQSPGYPSHQDIPVTKPTTHRYPHLPISTHLRQSHQKLPPQSVCVQYQLHGIDSNSRYRFQRGVPISHRGIPYLKTHILKTSILIKSHIFRNPPFFTIV